MAILKAEIIAYVNAALGKSYSGSDLDIQIKAALDDLANMHVLTGTDTSQTLANGDTYLTYPSDSLETKQAIRSIKLTDSNSLQLAPLKQLRGGYKEYLRLMESFSTASRSEPAWYAHQDGRLYLWTPPGGSYTVEIRYYKLAQAVDSGIEFPESWRNAIYFGTIYQKALLGADSVYRDQWEPRYYGEKANCRLRIPRENEMEGA